MSPRPEAPVPAGAEPEEIELKLAVAQQSLVEDLVRHPPPGGIAGFQPAGAARTVVCVDRYFDTSDGALRAGGVRARLREQDGAVVLAVKASIATEGAVSRRVELQGPATARFDMSAWPPSAARARIEPLAGDRPILEVAALRQVRLQRNFEREATTVELSLDEMTALEGERELATRVEVEAELLTGDAGLLQELAVALATIPGVAPAEGSKLAFAVAARGRSGA